MSIVVGIVMGSDSDYPIVKKAAEVFDHFGVGFEMKVASAHRSPDVALRYARDAKSRGLKVIIGAAGAAAHLCGVLASSTPLPVIGIPVNATSLSGLDALYAMVQMPSGIPVATMAIDGAKNAALFAIQILSLSDPELAKRWQAYKDGLASEVERKNARLQEALKKDFPTLG